jgi:hypothetical protein
MSASELKAYSLKIRTGDGVEAVFPRALLTSDHVHALAGTLQNLAREAGSSLLSVHLEPVITDDRDRLVARVGKFLADASAAPVRTAQTGIQCTSCNAVVPLGEAIDQCTPVTGFMSGDPIVGDARCEQCGRESMENCYECRTEIVISNEKSLHFICASCRTGAENISGNT